MKWLVGILSVTALAVGLTAAVKSEAAGARPPAAKKAANAAQIARGEYLVRTAGCNDCHTPMRYDPKLGMPAPDMTRMLSGHPQGAPNPQGTLGPKDMALIGPTFTAFKMQFGTVYVRNLTPDPTTGLGRWTPEQFVQAMRSGILPESNRAILPPMPWMSVGTMTDEDLRAMFAYLQSIPPIVNAVPEPAVPPQVLQQMAKANAQIAAQMKQQMKR